MVLFPLTPPLGHKKKQMICKITRQALNFTEAITKFSYVCRKNGIIYGYFLKFINEALDSKGSKYQEARSPGGQM